MIASHDDDAERDPAWRVQLELVGTWSCDEEAGEFGEDLLRSFALAIGAITLHPYARAYVQQTVIGLGYPPFTLDMIEPVTALPDDHVVDIEPVTQPSDE